MDFSVQTPQSVNNSAFPSVAFELIEWYTSIGNIKHFGKINQVYKQRLPNRELPFYQSVQYKYIVGRAVATEESAIIPVGWIESFINERKSLIQYDFKYFFQLLAKLWYP